MTKRSMNMFEFIFAVFFILKVTKTANVSDWNWFVVFLPIIVNFIWKFFSWVSENIGLKRSANVALQDLYIDSVRKKAIKDSLKESLKK